MIEISIAIQRLYSFSLEIYISHQLVLLTVHRFILVGSSQNVDHCVAELKIGFNILTEIRCIVVHSDGVLIVKRDRNPFP